MRDKRWLMLVIAALVIVADRFSKLWIEAHVRQGQEIVLIPKVFSITHVLNLGAAFSFFDNVKNPAIVRNVLIGFSVIAIAVVLGLLWKLGRTVTLTSISLALILGGATGNLYDRAAYHHVVDFLKVMIGTYHWPDFNVADSAIVVGACLLLLEMLKPQKDHA